MTHIVIKDKAGKVMGNINEATGETTITEDWRNKTPEDTKEAVEETEKEDDRE